MLATVFTDLKPLSITSGLVRAGKRLRHDDEQERRSVSGRLITILKYHRGDTLRYCSVAAEMSRMRGSLGKESIGACLGQRTVTECSRNPYRRFLEAFRIRHSVVSAWSVLAAAQDLSIRSWLFLRLSHFQCLLWNHSNVPEQGQLYILWHGRESNEGSESIMVPPTVVQ